jgi:PAS domain S-box-containing protein
MDQEGKKSDSGLDKKSLMRELAELRQRVGELESEVEQQDVFFSQSMDGFFFMMLDEPIRWDDTVDKESVLDYVFAHQRITKINDAMLAQYRASREQFLGLTPSDFFAHDIAYGRAVWREFFDQGSLEIQTRERKLDGTPMWIGGEYVCLYDREGRITGHFGVQREITKQVQATDALRESEESFRLLFEGAPIGMSITALDGGYTRVNQAFSDAIGYTPEELLDRTIADLSHPDDLEYNLALREKVLQGEMSHFDMEKRYLGKEGETVHTLLHVTLMRDSQSRPLHFVGQIVDISERKHFEEALRESEARYRSLFEHSPVSLWEEDFSEVKKDIDRLRDEGISDLRAYFEQHPQAITHYLGLVRVLDVNQAALKLHGAGSKEALRSIENIVVPEEALRVFQEALITFAEGETYFEAESPQLTLDGDKRHTHGRTAILPGCEETWSRVLVSSVDITGRVRAESQREAALEALRESEEKYRELFELESDAIVLIDNESGQILEVNSAASALYGFTREEMLGKKNADLSAEAEETRRVTQTTPVAADRVVFIPLRFHRKRDGRVFPVEITGRFFVWRGRSVHIAAMRDITERRRAEEEREGLIGELKEALAQVKTLSGMLPICSSCKKIRDDAGYWQQVEVYIRDHSEAEFTHGLCPDCAARLYPEFYRKKGRSQSATDEQS